jgi:serine protease Do
MFRRFFGPMVPGMEEGRTLRQPPRSGLGSGVIVSADGYILTNNHVVEGFDKLAVTLADGRELSAKVIGRDEKTDLAVIKMDGADFPAITFADSDQVEVGDRVLAVGNPFGIGQTVTTGIVSATGRAVSLGLDYEDFIQTDAAINPGNSGGALVDMEGRLIGVNTAILSRSGGFQGIGLAIPSGLSRNVMDSLVQYGRVTRGFLGVSIQTLTPDLAEAFGLDSTKGVVVTDIAPDSPASKSELKRDDVLLSFNGVEITDARRLKFAVAEVRPGTEVSMEVSRDGKPETISLTVGNMPGEVDVAETGSGSSQGVLNDVKVTNITPAIRREFSIPAEVQGAVVSDVVPGSAPDEAGLRPGDVIQEINRKPVASATEAVEMTGEFGDGKTLLRLWSRGGTHYLIVDESS